MHYLKVNETSIKIVKEECTFFFNICPKIPKLFKSHENTLTISRIHVNIKYQVTQVHPVFKTEK